MEELIAKYNATEKDYNKFKFHEAKEIVEREYKVCEKRSEINNYECLKKKKLINLYFKI